jgi:predicted membrane protein
MGLNLSTYQIAKELGLNRSDVQAMTTALRQGIVARRPEHRISQLFAALVAAGSIQTVSGAGATTFLQTRQEHLGASLAWIHDLAQMALVVVLILIVFLYPTGQPPSHRWR